MSDSVLLGLNVTNHVSAHCNILTRSELSRSAEATGSSTMIKDWCHQQISVYKSQFRLQYRL